jgi:hypothetical protein
LSKRTGILLEDYIDSDVEKECSGYFEGAAMDEDDDEFESGARRGY